MSFVPKALKQFQLSRLTILVLLGILIIAGGIPAYLAGRWNWQHPPQVKTLRQLKAIQKTGLAVPGWETVQQRVIEIGGHKWSLQQLRTQPTATGTAPTTPANSTSAPTPAITPTASDVTTTDVTATDVVVLLYPQTDSKTKPEVEWTDISGAQNQQAIAINPECGHRNNCWTEDSHRTLKFTVPGQTGQPVTVEARFLRGWSRQQTVALVQWYAWATGGSPAPSQWFWADRLAQIANQRQPWVAVCLILPIEPLGNIESVRSVLESLAKAVQTALITTSFQVGVTDSGHGLAGG